MCIGLKGVGRLSPCLWILLLAPVVRCNRHALNLRLPLRTPRDHAMPAAQLDVTQGGGGSANPAGATSCTQNDLKLINRMGPGHHNRTFPGLNAACGFKSWSWKLAFLPDKHVTCLQETLAISTSCGQCFASEAKFGFDNCKVQCLTNWCSQKCLVCTEDGYAETLKVCVGSAPPKAYACDDSGYNVPTVPPEPTIETTPTTTTMRRSVDPPGKVIVPKAKPQTTTTTTQWKQLGNCTHDDMQAMTSAAPGNADGSFPKICADCGSSSVSWTLRMQGDKYKSCVQSKLGLSSQCAACFLDSAEYGLDNCKFDCMSSWCSKGCLMCVAKSHDKLNSCIGFKPPPAWACDGSGYGATTTTRITTSITTTSTTTWRPENELPLGRIVALYNSAVRRFIRMDGGNLVSGPEKWVTDAIEDSERFTIVDASRNGSGDLIALYCKAQGRFISLHKNDESSMPTITTSLPTNITALSPRETLAVVAVAASGNVKTIALANAGNGHGPEYVFAMDPQGSLTMKKPSAGLPAIVQSRETPLILDSEDGSAFVVIDQGVVDGSGAQPASASCDPVPCSPAPRDPSKSQTEPVLSKHSGPSWFFFGCSGVALTLSGGVGGYLLARYR